ncbi:MAG: ABC-2 family transporter protein [Opitutaceae bacterium]|nr:ABC-2 family transporter protein [Opitutaceae bacterium]
MLAVLAKYRAVFVVGLQSSLVYRWNFAVRAAFSLVHLAFVFILWGAAFAGQTQVGGFDLRQTLTYFIVMLVLQFFISAMNEDYEVSEDIRNGLINQFLLKPVNYYLYRLTVFVSARLVSGALALLPVLLALPLLAPYLTLPPLSWNYAAAVPALVMSALIQFTIAYCFGLLTFWFLEIQSFIILSLAVETVLGGQVFPLDLLPRWLYDFSAYLPYYYQMYFPVALLTGRITDEAFILRGLGIQLFWVIALLGVAQLLWHRGLRRHTAVGG